MIKEVLVVEGKNDIHAVKRAVEADCIATGGFGLSTHTLERIAQADKKRGIIILTDPDSAGERIRSFLSRRFPNAKHAFIPKEEATAHDDIGIEQASPSAIVKALAKVRYVEWQPVLEFSQQDMMQAGLSGNTDASRRRAIVGAALGIGYANGKTFLQRLNHYGVTREEFAQAIAELDGGQIDETAENC